MQLNVFLSGYLSEYIVGQSDEQRRTNQVIE